MNRIWSIKSQAPLAHCELFFHAKEQAQMHLPTDYLKYQLILQYVETQYL